MSDQSLSITSRQRTLIMVGTIVGMLVAAVSQTIVSTVGPSITADLGNFDLYPWVFTAAALATVVTTPIFGKVSDLYGRRNPFIVGVAAFVLGTLVCAVAQSMGQLIGGRVVQGIGMGAIMPLAMAIVADVIPATERGKWQGIMGAVFGLATVLGPLAGGVINDTVGWRWTFWVMLPLGLAALALIVTQLHIPFVPRRAKFDWLGALTFGGGLSALTLGLTWGGSKYDWGSGEILGLFGAAVALLLLFVVIETRASEPLIPMGLFRDRNVSLTALASLTIGAAMYAGIIYVPLFMQSVAGLSSSSSGVALAPLMVGLILTSIVSGVIIGRTRTYKAVIVSGPIIGALGLWLLSRLGPDASIADTAWRVAILGGGIGMTMQNVMLVAQNAVETRQTGVVTSLLTLTRTLGGTISVAILGTVFTTRFAEDMRSEAAGLAPADLAALQGAERGKLLTDNRGFPDAVQGAIHSAAADSITHLFVLALPFLAVCLLAALSLRRDELSDRSAISVVEDIEMELAGLAPGNAVVTGPAAHDDAR